MFEMLCLIADPDFYGREMLSQIIDVPVVMLVHAPVTRHPRSHPTLPKRAADIDVISRFQANLPPVADLYPGV